jgi:two-component system, chemotaxis family, response regulator Rcp1
MYQSVNILLVEDNESDIVLTCEAFKRVIADVEFSVVRNGVEAMNFLKRRKGYEKAVTPQLILLDINTPKRNGFEVLDEIHEDENLNTIPIIVVSSSDSVQDIAKAYLKHATSYMLKPPDFKQYLAFAKTIQMYWLTSSPQHNSPIAHKPV